MKGLFDASAIINLAISSGAKATGEISGGYGIPLTFYELGNSVWKLHLLLKRISKEEAKSLLENSLSLYGLLGKISLEGEGTKIEELAISQRITFYESSYLYAAKRENLTLVTDDERLTGVAKSQKISVVSSVSTA
jgi:predicted nucleic acid-binding protein